MEQDPSELTKYQVPLRPLFSAPLFRPKSPNEASFIHSEGSHWLGMDRSFRPATCLTAHGSKMMI